MVQEQTLNTFGGNKILTDFSAVSRRLQNFLQKHWLELVDSNCTIFTYTVAEEIKTRS